jgi:predicted transcriptional regulator
MNRYHDLLNIPIKDVAAHIFGRPCLSVDSASTMLELAPFLAIGPQIYADGLVIANKSKKSIDRLGSKHIISTILKAGYPKCLEITAEQMMDDFAGTVDMNSPLSNALQIFTKTRFAFVPITLKDYSFGSNAEKVVAIASLSIRDILPLLAKSNIDIPVKGLCSTLISVDRNTSIRNAIDFMMKHGIRNIGINENADSDINNNNHPTKLLRIINDRKILEFLFSHNGRELMQRNGATSLTDIGSINHLDMITATKVKRDATNVSRAAELLMDIRNPCLTLEAEKGEKDNFIVTPWDIVMKTMI